MHSGGDKPKRKDHRSGRRPIIGGDLRIGLVLTLGLGVLSIPRYFLTGKRDQSAATTAVASQGPAESTIATEHAIAVEPAAAPAKLDPASAPSLTDVMPNGYQSKPESPAPAPIVALPAKSEPPKAEPQKSAPTIVQTPSPPKFVFPVEDQGGSATVGETSASAPKPMKEPPPPPNVPKATPAVDRRPVHPYFERFLERKEYFVREGDTLDDISRRLYGDSSKASEILAANGDKLRQPADLRSGMLLKLP